MSVTISKTFWSALFTISTLLLPHFFATAKAKADAVALLTYKVDSSISPVRFLAVGKPGFLRIKGEGTLLEGQATLVNGELTGEFRVKLDPLKTGIDLRDEHMKEKYLEVPIFPEAVLTIGKMRFGLKGSESTEFAGTFTLKGVTREIRGKAELSTDPDLKTIRGTATLKISLSDFKIEIPSHLGIKVAEDVEITAEFVARNSAIASH